MYKEARDGSSGFCDFIFQIHIGVAIHRAMAKNDLSDVKFMKMHGLGNDFVVVDLRLQPFELSNALICQLADRHRGIGFDQLAIIAVDERSDAYLQFYNSDGSASAACGNATRCIARHLMDEQNVTQMTLRTDRGLLICENIGAGLTAVNMGHPLLDWADIPLQYQMDTLYLPLDGRPTATAMGNPHCSYFVDDAETVDLAHLGPAIEHDPLFPQRTNVQVASILGRDHLRMRVWERGVGITLASGSSSCAVAVAAYRLGLTGRAVKLDLDGGQIQVDWRDDGVWLIGPTMHVATGRLTRAFLESV